MDPLLHAINVAADRARECRALKRRLARAELSLRVTSATLTEERRRAAALVNELEGIRRAWGHASGWAAARWVATLAVCAAERITGRRADPVAVHLQAEG